MQNRGLFFKFICLKITENIRLNFIIFCFSTLPPNQVKINSREWHLHIQCLEFLAYALSPIALFLLLHFSYYITFPFFNNKFWWNYGNFTPKFTVHQLVIISSKYQQVSSRKLLLNFLRGYLLFWYQIITDLLPGIFKQI